MAKSIYKSEQFKKELMNLYDQRLKAMNCSHTSKFIHTSFGKTHVLCVGDESLPPLVVMHGINAGAPMALEAIVSLSKHYCLYGIDTVGQVGRSSETRPSMKGNEYGIWLSEVLDGLSISLTPIVGVSYGSFLVQRLLAYSPEKISKAILIVPSGFGHGKFWESTKRLTFPLLSFFMSKSDEKLEKFMSAFYSEISERDLAFQKNTLLGVHMDYSRPTILKPSEVTNVEAEVYMILADDDVFFPKEISIEKCKAYFKNFKEYRILKGIKHIPSEKDYPEICATVKSWLEES